MSFVDRAALEPGCSVLLHSKGMQVVGLLADEADPAVSVMKVEHAPTETYADVGGLEAQVQEIKEAVELPLTHPELYEDIGVRPPKVRFCGWLGVVLAVYLSFICLSFYSFIYVCWALRPPRAQPKLTYSTHLQLHRA
jgi:hypothetical protein